MHVWYYMGDSRFQKILKEVEPRAMSTHSSVGFRDS